MFRARRRRREELTAPCVGRVEALRRIDHARALAFARPLRHPRARCTVEAAMTSGRGKVLIVDDDRDINEIASMVLTDAGFMVSVLMDMDAAEDGSVRHS